MGYINKREIWRKGREITKKRISWAGLDFLEQQYQTDVSEIFKLADKKAEEEISKTILKRHIDWAYHIQRGREIIDQIDYLTQKLEERKNELNEYL